ncbi:MAG: NAD(P)-dependent glycerol-3-phosphate dehydrogenase [Desulfobacteraceae bacterium]|nr:NAD(P)-dependent glycerol-3-phosphate dehydrogenase [Desulfobacteraceae bacterium]
MDQEFKDYKIGVIGAGSWGTALANLLAVKGFPVELWVYEEDVCLQIKDNRENEVFLPGIKLSENLSPDNDLYSVSRNKDLLLLAVPSHFMRDVSMKINSCLKEGTIIVSASKGIENKTHLTMSGVLKETLSSVSEDRIAVLYGPSFAREVAQGLPTVVTAASADLENARRVQNIFATPAFRVYTNDDVIGVELGGSVKNVIAIAAGVIDGLELGLNTRAALITRGLTEIRRLGLAMGANPRTFTGLTGVGDLVLTCTGTLSRNHTVGVKIGQGMKLDQVLSEMRMVAEGVKTARSVYNLSRRLKVEMPIAHAIFHILYEDLPPRDALYQLMTRNLKHELDEK